jgi:hypothetical protein
MNEYTARWLGEVETIVRTAYRNRDSDSVEIQNFRAHDQAVGHELLQLEIREHRLHDKNVVLRVGEQAIRGLSFSKIEYDFLRSKREDIPAGESINLNSLHLVRDTLSHDMEPYYGQFSFVNFNEIGRTLTEGGSLETVDATELEELRATSVNE